MSPASPSPEGFGTRTIVLRRRHKWKLVVAGGVLLLAIAFMYLLSEIFAPLLIALLLAYILNPVACWFERRGFSRRWAVRVIYLVMALVVAGLIAFGIPMAVQQVVDWTWAIQGEYVAAPGRGEPLDPDVQKTGGEEYADANGNGKYDRGEDYDDLNGNGMWDPAELLARDHNGNGIWDPGDEFVDRSPRNGVWDAEEPYRDLNSNGFRDSEEPWTDINWNGEWDEWLYFIDYNHNGKPDGGYVERIRVASADPEHWFGKALRRVWRWEGRQRVIDEIVARARQNASALAAKSAQFASFGARTIWDIIAGTLYLMMAVILIPIYTYFFLMGLGGMYETAVSYVPRNVRDEAVHILEQIHQVNAAFFRGRLVICIIMGAVSTAGFVVFGLRFSLLFGAAMAVAGLVPFLPVVVMIPAVLVALVDLPWWGVAGVILSGAVGQALDWPLSTWIMGKQLKLHPITIVISLFIFTEMLGVVGLLLSVPIVASLKVIGRELVLPHLEEIADGPPTASGTRLPTPPGEPFA